VIEGLMPIFIEGLSNSNDVFHGVPGRLPGTRLLLFIRQLLQYLSITYFDYTISREGPQWWEADTSRVGAAISLLMAMFPSSQVEVGKTQRIYGQIVENGTGLENLSIQRACVRCATQFGFYANTLVENLVTKWGDKAYINHTPISAQEGLALQNCPDLSLYSASSVIVVLYGSEITKRLLSIPKI